MYLFSYRFAVTSAMVEPLLEGHTLDNALAAKRIFIVDLEILSRLKLDEPRKVGCIVRVRAFESYLLNWD